MSTYTIELSKVKKGHTKARNGKVKNYHYNSMLDSGHSIVPFVLIGDNLHHQIIKSLKSLKRPYKDQKRPSQKWPLLPCPFTCRKMFCAGPTFLSHPKILTAFCASSNTFVLAQNSILLNTNYLFVWRKMVVTGTIRR